METNSAITITVEPEGRGLLVSLQTAGPFASEAIDRHFYSIDQTPPDGLAPADFWAPILGQIAGFLRNLDDSPAAG